MVSEPIADPVRLRVKRIRELEALVERVEAEIHAERAALVRIINRRPRTWPTAMSEVGVSPARIREWARANGYPDVGCHGRVPKVIVAAFAAAHPDKVVAP